jgi:beta-N-acetylhexosaminidase
LNRSREILHEPGAHLWVGFEGTTLDRELRYIIQDFRVGGIVLFKRNIESPDQLRGLLEEAQAFARESLGRGICVAIDQEGGLVQRLKPPFTQLEAARDLAAAGPEALIRSAAKAAAELRQTGIHINLAPVLDVVAGGKSSFMEKRSLSSDPKIVSELGAMWIRQLQEEGISATAKHFPGLGLAESDPHHFAPVIHWRNDTAMENDLLPFRGAVKAGAHCFMTSHALYPYLDPVWPATLSSKINRERLREEMGFNGVLLSDDLDMAAVAHGYSWKEMAAQGTSATIDFFLLCQRSENIEHFYRALSDVLGSDAASNGRHEESALRIERLLEHHKLLG